jgi:hypothetical protein
LVHAGTIIRESPSAWLKLYIYGFVHVDDGVINGMAAYQPDVLVCVLCGGRMKTQNHIYNFNQALGDSLMMVPA